MSEAAMDLDDLEVPGSVKIELGTAIQVELEGVSARTPGTLVGLVAERYLVLRLEGDREANYSKLFKGNTLVVRYLHDGAVYGFQSSSLGSVTSPDRLLFVSYPIIVAEQSLRKHPRTVCVLPATLSLSDETPARVSDLSVGGMKLVYREALDEDDEDVEPGESMPEVEDELSFSVTLPGAAEPQQFASIVRNRHAEAGGRCVLGVEFVEPSEELQEQLQGLIEQLKPI